MDAFTRPRASTPPTIPAQHAFDKPAGPVAPAPPRRPVVPPGPFSAPVAPASAGSNDIATSNVDAVNLDASGYRYADAGRAAAGTVGIPASFGARVGARLIDGLILGALTVLPVWIVVAVVIRRHIDLFSVTGALLAALLVLELVPLVGYLIYRIGSDGGSGRSVGRAAMGIRLVAADGPDPAHPNRVGYGRAVGRLIVSALTDWFFFLGSLSMLWDPEARTWADKAAGTRVIIDRSRRPGPGRVLAAAAAACALITLVAGISGVHARDSFERQLASALTFGTDNDGLNSGVDGDSATGIDPSTTDPSSTDPGSDFGNTDPSTSDGSGSDSGLPTDGDVSSSPSQVGVVTVDTPDDSLSQSVAASLDDYFSGINAGNYAQAWERESTRSQAQIGTLDSFSADLSSTQNSDIELHDAIDNGDGTVTADVTFTSHQDAAHSPDNSGDTCDDWTITYSLVPDDFGGFLIDSVPQGSHLSC